MPGPGGGSRGGGGGRGFGGGGSFGGGRGGSFGGGGRGFGGGHHGGFGGHHHGPHFHGPHFHRSWHFGPRGYYGGGCASGVFSMIIVGFVMVIFFMSFASAMLGSACHTVSTGGDLTYEENQLQDYADEQYAAAFGAEADYEDNLLIVFLVEDEEYYEYAYIAWVGDHIDYRINNMFGGDGSSFGDAVALSAINSGSYKYSLDSGIASVMNRMRMEIDSYKLESSFVCDSKPSDFDSHLVNKTSLDLTESTVNRSLTEFTEATGIPVVVVVEYADNVFDKNLSGFDIFSVIMVLAIVIVAIVLIVKSVKKNKPTANAEVKTEPKSEGEGDKYNRDPEKNNHYNRD